MHITSDYGRIGPFNWVNSHRAVHFDYCTMGFRRTWGGWRWVPPVGRPRPGEDTYPYGFDREPISAGAVP